MPVKDGSTILQGVDWWNSSESITVKGYPASCAGGLPYKLQPAKTWVNKCGYCKKTGTLYAHGTKGRKKAPESEISCKSCDTDFDSVSGKSKEGSCRYSLTPGSSSSSTSTDAEKAALTRKEAIYKAKEEYKEKSQPNEQRSITTPIIPVVDRGGYAKLMPPLAKEVMHYISSVHMNANTMTMTLHKKYPKPDNADKSKLDSIKKK